MRLVILLAVALSLLLPTLALARTWTSREGKEIEGDFVDATEEKVTLKKADGKVFTFNVDRLSDSDQRFIRGLLARRSAKNSNLTEDSGNPFEPATGADKRKEEPLPLTSAPVQGLGTMRDINETKKKLKIENREWTDSRGNTTSGKFIRIQGNSVVILRGGRQANLDYWQLSQSDQNYLKEFCAANGLEHMIPKIDPATIAAAAAARNGSGGFSSPANGDISPRPGYSAPANGTTTTTIPGFSTPTSQRANASVDPEELARRLRELQNNPVTTPSYTPPPSSVATSPSPSYSPPPSSYSPPPTSYAPPPATSYPSTTSPSANYTPPPIQTMPIPSYNMPSTFNPPTVEFGQKQCENCGKVLSANFTAGDKCPGCGIYFSVDRTNGKTSNVGWGGGGMSVPVKAVIVLVVLAVMGLGYAVQRSQQ